MKTLTKEQIARQDFVDNVIHEMLEKLLGRELEHDIEPIAEIREIIVENCLKDDVEEMAFYPYVEREYDTSE